MKNGHRFLLEPIGAQSQGDTLDQSPAGPRRINSVELLMFVYDYYSIILIILTLTCFSSSSKSGSAISEINLSAE